MSVLVLDSPVSLADERTNLAVRICRDTGAWYRYIWPNKPAAEYRKYLSEDAHGHKLTVWDGSWMSSLADPIHGIGLLAYVKSLGGCVAMLDHPHSYMEKQWEILGLTVIHVPVTEATLSAIYLGLEQAPFFA